jgi:hypothetical protein
VPRFRLSLLLLSALVFVVLAAAGGARAEDGHDGDAGAHATAYDPDSGTIDLAKMIAVFELGHVVWEPRSLAPALAAAGTPPPPPARPPRGRGSNPEGNTTTVVDPAAHDVSPPLTSMLRPAATVPVKSDDEDSNPRIVQIGVPMPSPDGAVQKTPIQPAPPSTNSFEGAHNTDGYVPPDTNGDVGGDYYVEWVNAAFSVYDKNTGALDPRMTTNCSSVSLTVPACEGNSLWAGFTGAQGQSLCASANQGDPIVKYDKLANRWIFTQFAFQDGNTAIGTAGPYYQCVAVSTSADPFGTYNRYAYLISNSNLNDYPKVGIMPDGYYFSFNLFSQNTGNFAGTAVAVADRASILAGNAKAKMIVKTLGGSTYGLLPADLDGSTPPPSGSGETYAQLVSPELYSGNPPDELQLFNMKVNWATSSVTFTGPTSLPTAAFETGPVDGTDWVTQPDGGEFLDALSDRLMYRLAYRNLGSKQLLAVTHTVDGSGGSQIAAPRWYELQNTGGGWSIADQGTYAPDSTNRWMASMAIDHDGNLGMVYSFSSASIYPSVGYTGRLTTDPAGTLETGTTLVSGNESQNACYSDGDSDGDSTPPTCADPDDDGEGPAGRWGDYSSATIDPSDDCTFFVAGEYFATGGESAVVARDRNWHTRVGSFFFPGCMDFTPGAGSLGSQVVIHGKRFENATAVSFNGAAASTWSTDSTAHTLTVTVPSGATTGPIQVVAPAGTFTSETDFSVVPGITSFSPASGLPGDLVDIYGGPFTGASAVKFNGTAASTYTVDDATHIEATVPNGATSGPISVTVGAAVGTSATSFTVLPYVAGASPGSAVTGTTVTINGSGLTGSTAVQFNGVSTKFKVLSDTQISAVVPANATYGQISVTAPGGTVHSAGSFTVIPTLSGVSSKGQAGQSIKIKGSGLLGVVSVTFNGVSASFSISSAKTMSAVVPPTATMGPIVVTLGGSGQTASAGPFRPQPVVTGMTPASGPVSTSVVVTGTNLGDISSVSIGNLACPFTVNSPTKITLTIPAGARSSKIKLSGPTGNAGTPTFTVT